MYSSTLIDRYSRFLRSINVNLEDITAALPDAKVSTGLFAIDTQDMFAALEGSNDVRSLERVSRHLHVAGDPPFHNAGNDAHVRSPYQYSPVHPQVALVHSTLP